MASWHHSKWLTVANPWALSDCVLQRHRDDFSEKKYGKRFRTPLRIAFTNNRGYLGFELIVFLNADYPYLGMSLDGTLYHQLYFDR